MPVRFGQDPKDDRGLASASGHGFGTSDFGQTSTGAPQESSTTAERDLVPTLGLPKGGAAHRGMGEQFQMSAFTGRGALNRPTFPGAWPSKEWAPGSSSPLWPKKRAL